MAEFQVSAQVLKPAGSLTLGLAKRPTLQYTCPLFLPPACHSLESEVFLASLPVGLDSPVTLHPQGTAPCPKAS